MPDANNPLEAALRQIKDHLIEEGCFNSSHLSVYSNESMKRVMAPIRAILINFRDLEAGIVKYPQLLFCDTCSCSYITKCQCPD